MELIVHRNPEAEAAGINPFDHGSAPHRPVEDRGAEAGARQVSASTPRSAAPAATRRRAGPRSASSASAPRSHRWDPKNQRPELWRLYNVRKTKGESFRVFPLSNWTELDIWQYIHAEGIAIVPLYFAAPRPTVERDGLILMVDDERFRLRAGEAPVERSIRFRTLGCYPLTGAVESEAASARPTSSGKCCVATTSERQGRAIDRDAGRERWRRRSRRAISDGLRAR